MQTACANAVPAHHTQVPSRFRAQDITDTVLGSISVATCDAKDELRTITFGTDGRLTMSPGDNVGGGEAWLRVPGVVLSHTRLVCDLSTMTCDWKPHSSRPLQLPLYDGGHSRVQLRLRDANLTLTRNAMVDLGSSSTPGSAAEQAAMGGDLSPTEVDCGDFVRWPTAHAACAAVHLGKHRQQKEALLMLVGPQLRAKQRFHFMEVTLSQLDLEQTQVHGLLGQRALWTHAATAPARRHVAGVGAGGTVLPSEPTTLERVEGAPRAASNRPVDGEALLTEAAKRFGEQGEGAIEGVFTDYLRGHLGAHMKGKFARFAGCGSTQADRSSA